MQIINCPSCKRRLYLPEDGLEVSLQCPSCLAIFITTVNAAAWPRAIDLELVQEVGFRAGVENLPLDTQGRDHDVEEGTPHLFSLIRQKWPEGIVRRTLALVGFISGTLIGLCVFAGYAYNRRWGFFESLGPFVLSLVLSPVLGVFLAAIGAGFGRWIEIIIRLLKRGPGESMLLTLVGDEEECGPQSASKFLWAGANDYVADSDCKDITSQKLPDDFRIRTHQPSPPTHS